MISFSSKAKHLLACLCEFSKDRCLVYFCHACFEILHFFSICYTNDIFEVCFMVSLASFSEVYVRLESDSVSSARRLFANWFSSIIKNRQRKRCYYAQAFYKCNLKRNCEAPLLGLTKHKYYRINNF